MSPINFIHVTEYSGSILTRPYVAGTMDEDTFVPSHIEREQIEDTGFALVPYRKPINFAKLGENACLNDLHSLGFSKPFFPDCGDPDTLRNIEFADHIAGIISDLKNRKNWDQIKDEFRRLSPENTARFLFRLSVHGAPYIPNMIGSFVAIGVALLTAAIFLSPLYFMFMILAA